MNALTVVDSHSCEPMAKKNRQALTLVEEWNAWRCPI